ncbi:Calmodulin [Zancudomyces culisetae]|uniref:Phosphatidylinositol-glycan-specific phospholipase D n=1 Tax=Zancudomyces culisetae TaxID=1213189 RepID=A0A1R1PJ94_ZANCU|nr:Calmodulin [Zancudomyces culisetae]|eukprot:OMH81054.1 Calmodulin [Zancudomyces culisetae]
MLVLSLILSTVTLACGPNVHNEVTERARNWFKLTTKPSENGEFGQYNFSSILEKNVDALQAGALFPDWGYGCLGYDNEAEEAHWTPFISSAVEYLNENYKKPYNQAAEKLIAFIFGVSSHQVADELWHSIHMGEGLLDVLSKTEYKGRESQGHTLLDVGTDFYMRYIDELSYIGNKWSIPTADVIKIYKKMGMNVSRAKLQACTAQLYSAMQGSKRTGHLIFPSYLPSTNLLTDEFVSYFRGGLNSMAVQTHNCWECLSSWIQTNKKTCNCLAYDTFRVKRRVAPKPHIDMLLQTIRNFEKGKYGKSKHSKKTLNGIEQIYQDIVNEITIENDSNITTLNYMLKENEDTRKNNTSNFINEKLKYQRVVKTPFTQSEIVEKNSLSGKNECDTIQKGCVEIGKRYSHELVMYIDRPYAHLGTTIATGDFNGSGKPSLVIGAPKYCDEDIDKGCGGIFIVEDYDTVDKRREVNIREAAEQKILPPSSDSKSFFDTDNGFPGSDKFTNFGASLVVLDFDHDGIDDLVVGASWKNGVLSNNIGAVYIYLGRRHLELPSEPNYILNAAEFRDMDSSLDKFSIKIGDKLFAVDVDGDGKKDLVLGSPRTSLGKDLSQAGSVFVLFSSAKYTNKKKKALFPDIMITSNKVEQFEWFGVSADGITSQKSDGGDTVIGIGASGGKYLKESAASPIQNHNDQFEVMTEIQQIKQDNIIVRLIRGIITAIERVAMNIITYFSLKLRKKTKSTYYDGKVYGFTINKEYKKAEYLFDLSENTPFGFFGSNINTCHGNDGNIIGTFISAPNMNTGKSCSDANDSSDLNWQAGSTFFVNFIKQSGVENTTTVDHRVSRVFLSQNISEKLSKSIFCGENEVWLGAPYADHERGRVYTWDYNKNSDFKCYLYKTQSNGFLKYIETSLTFWKPDNLSWWNLATKGEADSITGPQFALFKISQCYFLKKRISRDGKKHRMSHTFSGEEVDEFREAFSLFDQDNDGYVSKAELGSVLRSLNRTITENELQELFVQADSDNDGKVNFNEFVKIMSKELEFVSGEDEILEAFKVFDKDGAGFIPISELRHIMTSLGEKLSEEEVEEMLKEADIYGDGKVYYDQFVKLIAL